MFNIKCQLWGLKESACSAGYPGSIPGLGRSLEKETVTHFSILTCKIPWMESSLTGYSPWGRKGSDTAERLSLSETK